MTSVFIFFLVIVAILLMGVVLIQASKGGGLAGTFGGGDATAVFGVRRTADFLIKVTSTLATILLLFSLVTNVIINKNLGTRSSFCKISLKLCPVLFLLTSFSSSSLRAIRTSSSRLIQTSRIIRHRSNF